MGFLKSCFRYANKNVFRKSFLHTSRNFPCIPSDIPPLIHSRIPSEIQHFNNKKIFKNSFRFFCFQTSEIHLEILPGITFRISSRIPIGFHQEFQNIIISENPYIFSEIPTMVLRFFEKFLRWSLQILHKEFFNIFFQAFYRSSSGAFSSMNAVPLLETILFCLRIEKIVIKSFNYDEHNVLIIDHPAFVLMRNSLKILSWEVAFFGYEE